MSSSSAYMYLSNIFDSISIWLASTHAVHAIQCREIVHILSHSHRHRHRHRHPLTLQRFNELKLIGNFGIFSFRSK